MTLRRSALAAFLALAAAASPAAAASSAWSDAPSARLRLVAPGGPPTADGSLKAAIEIELQPGWKTYWRSPGEAGMPPEIDFAASSNLAGARVDFPAPVRFVDGGSTSAGYSGAVVLPVAVTPVDPALPVMLAVKVDYGICREICVPATGEARVMLSAATAPDPAVEATVAAARAQVPQPADPAAGLAITAVAPDPTAEAPGTVLVTARLADVDAAADLFAEGPGAATPRMPALVGRDGAVATWRVVLDRYHPAPAGAPLRLTLVNGPRSVESFAPLP